MVFKSLFNQSYLIKNIIYLFQPLSWFLDFKIYFVG